MQIFFERTARGLPNILLEGEKPNTGTTGQQGTNYSQFKKKKESEKKRKKKKEPPLRKNKTTTRELSDQKKEKAALYCKTSSLI